MKIRPVLTHRHVLGVHLIPIACRRNCNFLRAQYAVYGCLLPQLSLRRNADNIRPLSVTIETFCSVLYTAGNSPNNFQINTSLSKLLLRFNVVLLSPLKPVIVVVCLSCPVCDVRALWPNGWTDQGETWQAGRPWSWPHCVRWGPSSPFPKGHSPHPIFGPYLLRPNGCIDQDATRHGARRLCQMGTALYRPQKRGRAPP